MRNIVVFIAHLIYWFVFVGFTLALEFRINEGSEVLESHIGLFLLLCIWALFVFYLFYFYFARTYLQKGKYGIYLFFSLLVSIVLTLMLHNGLLYLLPHLIETSKIPPAYQTISGTFVIAQTGSLIRGFSDWLTDLELKNELEKRNLSNELSLLKMQLSPHFLFNSLNNIDAMIKREPDQASSAIVSLSGMLRYMLYDTNKAQVSLNDEIGFLKSFVDLHRIRHKQSDYISFDVQDIDAQIAPMLFQPFVENAFKFASDLNSYPVIDLKISGNEHRITFLCSNSYSSLDQSNIEHKGIGIANVRRRLELIYKDQHELTITEQDSVFCVKLTLVLNDD
ncbi:MAG: histidine kinase [Reichenbachiella sp.]